jgi:hypothetical protein
MNSTSTNIRKLRMNVQGQTIRRLVLGVNGRLASGARMVQDGLVRSPSLTRYDDAASTALARDYAEDAG